jgi:hypothetical protein
MPNLKKEAARTIKRSVVKHYVRKAFLNYTGNNYANIKSGKAPTKAPALYRRMKMFPVTVNVPLYRGITNKNGSLYKQLQANGVLKNSFASFSRNKRTANSFAFGMPSMNVKHIVLILPPGRYPGINSRTFRSKGHEVNEVLLAPGKYTINKNKTKNNNFVERFGFRSYLHMKYTPNNKLSYYNYKSRP